MSEEPNYRPQLFGVISDLCHQLGVDPGEVVSLTVAPGTVDVLLRSRVDGDMLCAGVWRRFTFPLGL